MSISFSTGIRKWNAPAVTKYKFVECPRVLILKFLALLTAN
jgi:hypothetical protein